MSPKRDTQLTQTITERLINDGLTTEERAKLILNRIVKVNPSVNAIRNILYEQTLTDANKIDKLIESGKNPGPLAGVLVAVKEIIDTTPAVCSAGLSFLDDYRPTRDASVVSRLRDAGAIVIGTTISDPGAFGVRTIATSHPHSPTRTVGGSSGGSGAALSADFCDIALGTDTGGSIRIPAACCAVVGLKPTRGRVSTKGVRPLVWSLDHVGPMARSVPDLLDVQRILDPNLEKKYSDIPDEFVIGHDPRYYRDAATPIVEGMAAALSICRSLGFKILDIELPDPEEALKIHLPIFCAESAAYYNETFPNRRGDFPETAKMLINLAESQTGYEYVQAMRHRTLLTKKVESSFKKVNVILTPTLPILPPLRDTEQVLIAGIPTEFTLAMIRYTCLFNHTGHPVVAMPSAVFENSIASSIQVVSRLNGDRIALALAQILEDELKLDTDFDFAF